MTKKEQAVFDDSQRRLRIALAFRFTVPVAPDLAPPTGPGIVNGWTFSVYRGKAYVDKACSSSVFHGIGQWDKTTAQRTLHLYSTEALAWKAARYELEQQSAQALAEVDARLEELK